MDSCAVCGEKFVKTDKGYNRFSLRNLTSPYSAKKVFPSLKRVSTQDKICLSCVSLLKRKTFINKRTKRRRWSQGVDTHTVQVHHHRDVEDDSDASGDDNDHTEVDNVRKRPADSPCIPSKSVKMRDIKQTPQKDSGQSARFKCPEDKGFRERACTYILNSKYLECFKLLITNSDAAKDALMKLVFTEVKKEFTRITRRGSGVCFRELHKDFSCDNVESFTWDNVVTETEELLPVFFSSLNAAFPSAHKISHQVQKGSKGNKRSLTEEEGTAKRNARLGTVVSVCLHSNSPRRYKFTQSSTGLQMWCEGASQNLFREMNYLGLTHGIKASISLADRTCEGYDNKVKQWKKDRQTTEVAPLSINRRRHLVFTEEGKDLLSGFGVCFDNVQFHENIKHHSTDRKKAFHLFTLMFAIKDRAVPRSMPVGGHLDPHELPVDTFIPNMNDFDDLRHRLEVIVQRIMVDYIPCLEQFQELIVRHLPHPEQEAMSLRSDMSNLGVIDANPSDTGGTLKVLDHLRSYVPEVDDMPLGTACHGDGLTIECIMKAKRARTLYHAPTHDVSCFIESAQEFHKEGILLQDTMNQMCKTNSQGDIGTLQQVKIFFNHQKANTPVMTHFQHVWDLTELSTKGLTLLIYMEICNITNIEDVPKDYPVYEPDREQIAWIQRCSASIVDRIWQQVSQEDLNCIKEGYNESSGRSKTFIPEDDKIMHCFCHEDKDDEIVKCCNRTCERTMFHFKCVDPPLHERPVEDWFCSTTCEESDTYIFCNCHRRTGEDMVQCALGDKCKRHEWYHLSCVGFSSSNDIPDLWHCSDQCALGEGSDDSILSYSLDLLWQGLNHLVRRDAVREGDGPALLMLWRIDMLGFWNKKHPRYFRIGHRLLANAGGILPQNQTYQFIWNRVGNLNGKKGGNLALDLINELLNNAFKTMLKRSNGMYTPNQVTRCSRMAGTLRKELRNMLSETVCGDDSSDFKHVSSSYSVPKKDVLLFVSSNSSEALFSYCPPRCHSAFPDHIIDTSVQSPYKLGSHLKFYTMEMNKWDKLLKKHRSKVQS